MNRLFGNRTIRERILLGFVLIALFPALAISAGNIFVGYSNGRQQAINRLESTAARMQSDINALLQTVQNEIYFALSEEYMLDRSQVILKLAASNYFYDYYFEATRFRLQRFVRDSGNLIEICLVDPGGKIVLSTTSEHDGLQIDPALVFASTEFDPQFRVLETSRLYDEPLLYTEVPIVSIQTEITGRMLAISRIEILTQILTQRTGLEQTGKAYLVDTTGNGLLIMPDAAVQKEPPAEWDQTGWPGPWTSENAVEPNKDGYAVYEDINGATVLGVYRQIPAIGMTLFAEQNLFEAFNGIYMNLAINLGVGIVSIVLAILASVLITRGIARPIDSLVEAARRITAGDLHWQAEIRNQDEIGFLAKSFNSMTGQLRELIGSLENRVGERTKALESRAKQLEIITQVSQEITSILDIDDLLVRIVELIRLSFGYYHVNIYLLDRENQKLELKASSGEQTPSIHQFDLDTRSINTHVIWTGKAIVVNNVQESGLFYDDRNLSETRSELVIPLWMGENIIGTLDVQEAFHNAFREEDMVLLQTLGDQIAVAIENARHYAQTQNLAVLEERNRLARELHDSVTQSLYSMWLITEGWRAVIGSQDQQSTAQYLDRISEINQQVLKEMRLLIYELRPSTLEEEGLIVSLQKRLDAVENRAGMQTRFIVNGLKKLPPDIEKELYNISIEALTNSLKHSEAQHINIQIYNAEGSIVLEISDDGKGFDLDRAKKGGGMGLVSIQERVNELGGALEIITAPGKGTRIKINLKLEDGLGTA